MCWMCSARTFPTTLLGATVYVDPLTAHIRGLPPDLQRLVRRMALDLNASLRRDLEAFALHDAHPNAYCVLVRRTSRKPRDFRVVQDYQYRHVQRDDGFYDIDYSTRVPQFYVFFQEKVRRTYEAVAEHAHPDVIDELADMVLTDRPEEYTLAVVDKQKVLGGRMGTYSRRHAAEFVRDAHCLTANRFVP